MKRLGDSTYCQLRSCSSQWVSKPRLTLCIAETSNPEPLQRRAVPGLQAHLVVAAPEPLGKWSLTTTKRARASAS